MAIDIITRDCIEATKPEANPCHNHSSDDLEQSSPESSEASDRHLVWCHQKFKKMSKSKRKQVTGGPASFKGEFSFVNKDASNIDSKDHNAAVSFHVMNRYEKWKKHEQAKRLRASASLPANPALSAQSSYALVRRWYLSNIRTNNSN